MLVLYLSSICLVFPIVVCFEAFYGLSAAFMPLRPTDAQHLDLKEVMKQLPETHHFRLIQLPLNFAEADAMWVGLELA